MLTLVTTHGEMLVTLELLIYPSLTLILLLAISCFLWSTHHQNQTITHHVNINVDKCASEDCVRCNKYKHVLKLVDERFKLLVPVSDGRLHDSLKNLKREKSYTDELQQPNVLYVNDLLALPWWTEEEFVSDITIIESCADIIRQEFEHVYNNVWPSGWLVNTTPTGQWAVFHLINQGAVVTANCRHCPETQQLLTSRLVSNMSENIFANASFSVVQSGTHISPHYGPTNIRIRCHLGLRVTREDKSYLNVNGERRSWRSGKTLLFDDSFRHEVVHESETDEPRAVLLVDFWHPGLTQTERETIDRLFKFQPTSPQVIRRIPIDISRHIQRELL